MSECCEFHVGDVGAKIGLHFVTCDGRYDADLDVNGATLTMIFADADRELTVIGDASIVAADFGDAAGDKSDGRVMYVTEPGFFTVEGPMEVQGIADFGARRQSTAIVRFHVGAKLGATTSVVAWENGDLLVWENGDLLAWENGT